MNVFKKIIIFCSIVLLFTTPLSAAERSLLLTMPPIVAATTYEPPVYVNLSAFNDFSCTSNWTNRDGALGLKAYSGSGSCEAVFPGGNGTYNIVLTIQTEFDGNSPYRVSVNGEVIHSGVYPRSSSLGCDCPLDNWRVVCPNKNVNVNLGTFTLKMGDKIEFWGHDDYPCGGEHGSYAEWHGITFTPVK